MPELQFLVVLALAVLLGCAVQRAVGLGVGLVAAPVLVFLDPSLMPGSLLVVSVTMPLLTVCAEWRHIDWRGLAWGLPARIPGTLAGAWLVGTLDSGLLGAVVGLTVLLAVAASLRKRSEVEVTPANLVMAGAASGVTGTATSISGPPLALLYQHQPAARVRGTLGAFFLVGALLSLLTLGATGELTGHQLLTGALLVPSVVAGYVAGRPLSRLVSASGLRTALLGVVSLSGVLLIVRTLL